MVRGRLDSFLSLISFWICFFFILIITSCTSETSEGEKLARTRCAACHEFVEPGLATRDLWLNGILPKMAEFMNIASADSIGKREYDAIIKYYSENSPRYSQYSAPPIRDSIAIFDFIPAGLNGKIISMIKFDSLHDKVYVGDGMGWLHIMNQNLQREDSMKLPTAPVSLIMGENKHHALCIGSMMPREDITGKLVSFNQAHEIKILVDSLRRPVFFQALNRDHTEFLISSFGYKTGSLAKFTVLDSLAKPVILDEQPGSMRSVSIDWNKDGLEDIVALISQGDERLVLFRNTGSGYTSEILVRFPPIYGSTSFELADFNNDNQIDILLTTGDNGDFSTFVKPYHGLRFFINDDGEFKEKLFLPMPGARDIRVLDFDGDKDLDIAAISFFPDNVNTPLHNFIYFENVGVLEYKPAIHSMSERGKWLVMEVADLEKDGDPDILLGSFQLNGLGTNYRVAPHEQVSFMMLRNSTRK
jgi:hypothetical protein